MKANELRIGNLLSVGNYDVKVVEIHHLGVRVWDLEETQDAWERFSDRIKPIPLTEEWLLKLGFEKVKGGISFDKGKLSIYLGDTILSGKNGRTYFNSWAILEESPKYIHQLQNLYFALVGEELTFKSE